MKIIVFDWCLIDNEKRPPTVEYYYSRMDKLKNLTRYYAQNEKFLVKRNVIYFFKCAREPTL